MQTDREFVAFPKIPRLRREIVVTEKIDGTNAAVVVTADGDVYAQSRKRIIVPGDDNFGFAAWVEQHKDVLRDHLGIGRHFGEWWGKGIQRGYGLDHRRFSLFNTHRWGWLDDGDVLDREPLTEIGVHCVPHLGWFDSFNSSGIEKCVETLRHNGSFAAPGFDKPEGVVVFHPQSQSLFKMLCENDDIPKSLVDA